MSKKWILQLAFFAFICSASPISLFAHDDRGQRDEEEYDLFDRQRDGLDWNQFDYPDEDPEGETVDCDECNQNYWKTKGQRS